MATERKIDENGNLLLNFSPEKSNFFKLLVIDDARAIEDWLVNNGHVKPHCPIRFISDEERERLYAPLLKLI